MRTIIVLTGSRALLGKVETPDIRPLVLLPIEKALSDDEAEIIEKNTGVIVLPIHYPHIIMGDVIGGLIDVTDPPVNPLPKNEQ